MFNRHHTKKYNANNLARMFWLVDLLSRKIAEKLSQGYRADNGYN